MSPDALLDALELINAIDLGDYDSFQHRKALVASVGMDEATIVAKVRMLQVMQLAFSSRFFDIEIAGIEPVPAAVIFALDAYERPLDLVGWPLENPARLATLGGQVDVLGDHNLDDWSPLSSPVPVYRTVVSWLRRGCDGVVPIERRRRGPS